MTIKQIESHAAHTGMVVGEFLYVGIALCVGLFAAVLVLSTTNPLDSPAIMGVFGAVALLGVWHHLWYRRHRVEVETSHEHHEARERRGF